MGLNACLLFAPQVQKRQKRGPSLPRKLADPRTSCFLGMSKGRVEKTVSAGLRHPPSCYRKNV